MTSKNGDDSSSDGAARLFAELLDSERRGETPDPGAIAAEHPEHAAELLEGLAMLSEIDSALADTAGGRQIGDFRILSEIGRGGMGVVYQAEQITLGRSVALKILPHTAMLDSKQVKRFQNEARSAGQLDHPHIVPVFAVGHDAGVHYYAMRLIDGESLRDVLAARRLPPNSDQPAPEGSDSAASTPTGSTGWFRTVAEWIRGVAFALEHSHQLGILHRDIKPANILIDHTGHPWITDFGLAWSLQQDANLTVTGEMLGTLAYCSPEQAAGRRRLVDQRADIYSLGVTLYELLTLRRPFESTDRAELLHKITNEVPRKPRRIDPRIPIDLETITRRAIAKAPEHRYQSAAEFASDLDAFLDGRPIAARPVGPVDRAWRWCRRNPGIASALAAAILMLSIAIVVGMAARQAITQRDRAQRAEDQVRIVQGISSARAELAGDQPSRRAAAFEDIADAAATWREADLEAAERASLELELRRVAIATLCKWGVTTREYPAQEAAAITAGPAFRFAARAQKDASVVVDDLTDGADAWETGVKSSEHMFAESGILVTLHGGRVTCLDVNARKVVSESPANVGLVAFDISGDQVLAVDPRGRLFGSALQESTWREEAQLVDDEGAPIPRPVRLSISPDGARLAVSFWENTVRIHARDGRQSGTIRDEDAVTALDWHPRGLLATGRADGVLRLWDVDEERVVAQAENHSTVVTRMRFDARYPLLVSQAWDNTTRLWHADDFGSILTFAGGGSSYVNLRGGKLGPIRSHDARIDRYYDTQRDSCARRFAQRAALSPSAPLSVIDPGNQLLATTTRSGVALFDLASGWLLRHVDCGPEPNSLEFTPEGLLYAGTNDGCWKITLIRDATGTLTDSRAERVHSVDERCMVALLRSGHLLIASRGTMLDLDPTTGERRVFKSTPHQSALLTVRHDERLAAVDSWHEEGAIVWDLVTGRIVCRVSRGRCRAMFGPRGHLWLAEVDRIRVFDCDSWKEVARVETPGAGQSPSMVGFSPDGKLVAITRERIRLEVRRVEDMTVVAEFEPEPRSSLLAPRFSPDGRWLVATSQRRFVNVWDLQKVRAGLGRLGLDWKR